MFIVITFTFCFQSPFLSTGPGSQGASKCEKFKTGVLKKQNYQHRSISVRPASKGPSE